MKKKNLSLLWFFGMLDLYVRKLWHWAPGPLFLVFQYVWKRKVIILKLIEGVWAKEKCNEKCPFIFPSIDNTVTNVHKNTFTEGKETKFNLVIQG